VSVIVFNAGFSSYVANWEMNNLKADPTDGILKVELGLLIFYLGELFLKLWVHGFYFFINNEKLWNWFDVVLIAISLYDQWTAYFVASDGGANLTFMRMFRLLKLSKIMRILRALRFLRELRLMLVAIAVSFLSFFWCVVMLVFILYIVSLICMQGVTTVLTEEAGIIEPEEVQRIMYQFGSVQNSVLSLYKIASNGGEWGELYGIVSKAGPLYSGVFLFFTAFLTFAIMNILTGMIVDSVVKASGSDDETLKLEYRHAQEGAARGMKRVFQAIDCDGNGHINLDEFYVGVQAEDVQALMNAIQIDVKDAERFFKLVLAATDSDEVDIDTFVLACMKIKGSASSLDLQSLMFETGVIHKKLVDLEGLLLPDNAPKFRSRD